MRKHEYSDCRRKQGKLDFAAPTEPFGIVYGRHSEDEQQSRVGGQKYVCKSVAEGERENRDLSVDAELRAHRAYHRHEQESFCRTRGNEHLEYEYDKINEQDNYGGGLTFACFDYVVEDCVHNVARFHNVTHAACNQYHCDGGEQGEQTFAELFEKVFALQSAHEAGAYARDYVNCDGYVEHVVGKREIAERGNVVRLNEY